MFVGRARVWARLRVVFKNESELFKTDVKYLKRPRLKCRMVTPQKVEGGAFDGAFLWEAVVTLFLCVHWLFLATSYVWILKGYK